MVSVSNYCHKLIDKKCHKLNCCFSFNLSQYLIINDQCYCITNKVASKDGFIVLFVHTHRRHFSGLDLFLCKLSQASYGRIFPVNPVFFRLLVHFSLVPRCQLRRKEDFYCFGLIVISLLYLMIAFYHVVSSLSSGFLKFF